jgi:hypothetical protein
MTIARACECKTANMREIVKAEGGKKRQTASRRNRSGVNFVATIVFIMCHLVLSHVNLGTRHHLHFCTGSGTVFLRDRTLSARCVCSAPSAVDAEYMRHIIATLAASGGSAISLQIAESLKLKQLEVNLEDSVSVLCRPASKYSYKFSYSFHGNFRTYEN